MPRSRRQLDWMAALDLHTALRSLHYEMLGDWYRDPWGWPELDWLVPKGQDMVLARLNSSGVRRAAKVDVPKENFGTRPAIVMDPVDRLAYQALVDRISKKLIGELDSWVFGWRLRQKGPRPGAWSHNDLQHKAFRDSITRAASISTCALRTDIVSFFASIDLTRLAEMMETRAGTSRMSQRVVELVLGWGQIAGRTGLAQRSAASAALANMYLQPIDDVLRAHERRRRGWAKPKRNGLTTIGAIPRVARWMDDIWVFGNDSGRLRVVQLELQDVLRSVGLELNHAKTELLEGDRVNEEVRQVQHSAVDAALASEDTDSEPLLALVERILDQPATADRTSVKFATKRMRDHEVYGPVPDFAEKAHQMPHAADALARLFRDSEHWKELPEWYVDYAKSPWGSIRWSVAQLGTCFPSVIKGAKSRKSVGVVCDYFLDLIPENQPLPLIALAARRVAAWDKDNARSCFRMAADSSDDPHTRRILALASANAGEDRAVVRRMLSEFEENQVTLKMIKDRSYRVPATADFEGG